MCSTLFPCQDPLFPLDWPFITQHAVQTTRQQEVEVRNGKEAKHRHRMRGGMRPDCWWSLMKHPHETQQGDSNQTPAPHSPVRPKNARHTQTLCSFMHIMAIKLTLSKVQGANRLNVQQERREKNSSFLIACLSSVSLHLFPRISQIRKKTFMREDSLSRHLLLPPVSSFILPCHDVESVQNSFKQF